MRQLFGESEKEFNFIDHYIYIYIYMKGIGL